MLTIKERIEAFVKQQGNQVGAGAELAAILNDILDAIPAAQVQSDWNQANNTKPDFIKNKPTIPSPYTLPAATAETLGGVKVGANLSITEEGVLSASGGSEPLILRGTMVSGDEVSFTPAAGFPSAAEIIAAYNSHRPIYQLVTYDDTEDTVFSPVAVCYDVSEQTYFVYFSYQDISYEYYFE